MSLPFWPEDIPAGTRIGGYTTGAKLGMGGTGVVYEARSPNGHLFALKVARQRRAVLDTPPSVDELRQERSIVCHGLLKGHPNVVQLYGYERHPDPLSGWPYQVLELVPRSRTITRWARETNPSLNEIAYVFQQLARLLGDMHSQGIRHRDIKPANILMAPDDQPKLADFGSASCIHTLPVTSNAAWAQPGTPGHLTPELCREIIIERQTLHLRPFIYEPSGDLHSLGVVLYEVLTGRHPFNLNLRGEGLLWHIANFEPAPLSEVNPAVPDGLEGIVMMLLHKDPGRRHESGYVLARELDLDWGAKSQTESWSVPFPVPGREETDSTPTAVLTEPDDSPATEPGPTTALMRVERWPSPVWTGASSRHKHPRGRRLVGCAAVAGLMLTVIMVLRMIWPAASVTEKGADVPHSSPALTGTKMLTALVCASIGGCAHVKVREADRDWLAQCSAEARESVRWLDLPRGYDTQASLLLGENVRLFPKLGVEVSPGPITAAAFLGQRQPARLHGIARVGEDGVSMRFTKLTIGDEQGNAGDGPWPAGKEFDLCVIAFDEGGFGTIGPGIPLDTDSPSIPASERRPGSAAILSVHLDIRVAR